jgi:hypothetical protein
LKGILHSATVVTTLGKLAEKRLEKLCFMAKPSKKYDLKSERSWANRPKNLTCVKSSRGQNCVFYKFLQNYEFQIVSGCLPGGIPGGLSQFSFTGFTCLRSMS